MKNKIRKRIEVLKQELSELLKQTEKKVAMYQAAIGELEALLKVDEIPPVETDK